MSKNFQALEDAWEGSRSRFQVSQAADPGKIQTQYPTQIPNTAQQGRRVRYPNPKP